MQCSNCGIISNLSGHIRRGRRQLTYGPDAAPAFQLETLLTLVQVRQLLVWLRPRCLDTHKLVFPLSLESWIWQQFYSGIAFFIDNNCQSGAPIFMFISAFVLTPEKPSAWRGRLN